MALNVRTTDENRAFLLLFWHGNRSNILEEEIGCFEKLPTACLPNSVQAYRRTKGIRQRL